MRTVLFFKIMETGNSTSPLNSRSIPSLVFGILTILFLCMGMIPVPFTGFICFPVSFLSGVLALVFGTISLSQIRRRNESGRPLAWIGILSGGFVLMCFLLMVLAIAALFIFAPNSIHLPPAIRNLHVLIPLHAFQKWGLVGYV